MRHIQSREQLVHGRVRVLVLLEHLGDCELEILLSDVLPTLTQRVHAYNGVSEESETKKVDYIPASVQIPRTSAPEQLPIFSASTRRLIPR
jgi:hypothetical protein